MTAVLNEHSRNSQEAQYPKKRGVKRKHPTWKQGVTRNNTATRRNRQSLVLSLSLLLQVSLDTWLMAHRSTLQSWENDMVIIKQRVAWSCPCSCCTLACIPG